MSGRTNSDYALQHGELDVDIAAAVSISVTGDHVGEYLRQNVFREFLVYKAAVILLVASSIAGILSILIVKNLISIQTKDLLIGAIYILCLGGALLLSGNLSGKLVLMLVANTAFFQSWNYLFFESRLAYLTFCIEIWLPIYWTLAYPSVMDKLGLSKKGLLANFSVGIIVGSIFMSYTAWGMKNFGFDFTLDARGIILNSGALTTIYLSIFCLFFMVWRKLRSWGISRNEITLALAIMSVSINAPSFICVSVISHTPPQTAFAGFIASTAIMILATNVTFEKLRSPIPATILFMALQNLLLITGIT